MLLERPADLRCRRCADRRRGLVRRVVEEGLEVDGLDLVRAERVHGRHLGEEASLTAVGALVEHEATAARNQRSVLAGAGLELDHHPLAPAADGDELLAPREDELHRATGRAGECRDVALEVEVALGAEAAAEQGDDDADVGLRDLQHMGDARPRCVRNLCGRPDRDTVALPLGDDRARLDRHSLHGVGDEPARDDDVGLSHRRIRIALDDRRVPQGVAVAEQRLVGLVSLPVGMDERCVVGGGGVEVLDRRKRLVVDLEERDLGGRRRDARDDVALEAHLLLGEEPAVLDHAAVEHVRHVLVRDDREDSRQCACLGRVDPRDPSVCVVGVAKLRVRLTGQREVGRVAADARHFLFAVRANERPLLDRRHPRSSRRSCTGNPIRSDHLRAAGPVRAAAV